MQLSINHTNVYQFKKTIYTDHDKSSAGTTQRDNFILPIYKWSASGLVLRTYYTNRVTTNAKIDYIITTV